MAKTITLPASGDSNSAWVDLVDVANVYTLDWENSKNGAIAAPAGGGTELGVPANVPDGESVQIAIGGGANPPDVTKNFIWPKGVTPTLSALSDEVDVITIKRIGPQYYVIDHDLFDLLVVGGPNVAPVITVPFSDYAASGGLVIFQFQVADSDGPNPVQVTANTGTVTPRATPGEYTYSHITLSDYTLTITADDGDLQSQANINVTKTAPVNTPPNVMADNAVVNGTVGVAMQNTGTFLDSDVPEQAVTFSADIGTAQKVGISGWQWDYTPTSAGTFVVTLTADDQFDTSDLLFTIIVAPANVVPLITLSDPPSQVEEGQTATASGAWSDLDGPAPVTLSADLGVVVQNPDGTWDWSLEPTLAQDGVTVTITADDTADTATVQFNLSVIAAPPVDTLTAVNDSVQMEAMTPTLVDVLANDTHDNASVSLVTVPSGIVASVVDNKVQVTMPFAASGQTASTIVYRLTEGVDTSDANLDVTVPNDSLLNEKPVIYGAQMETAAEIDAAIGAGWNWGLHAYGWSQSWLQHIKDNYPLRNVHLPFAAAVDETQITATDSFLPPFGANAGVGFTTKGQTLYDALANNATLRALVSLITLEFEGSAVTSASENSTDPNDIIRVQWVRDTMAFFDAQLQAIGLDSALYVYKVQRISEINNWSRLVYPYTAVSASNVSINFDNGYFPLRSLSGVAALAGKQVGAYIQGPRADPITQHGAWTQQQGTYRYVKPLAGHYLRQLYNHEGYGAKWLTFYNFRQAIGQTTEYPWIADPESWNAMVAAIGAWEIDAIIDNTVYTGHDEALGPVA